MRNLTKVLALVLSLAFVLTMFAGAVTTVDKYSDSAEATTAGDEAVTVLSALGIVNGYLDNSYGFDGNVTRAEFAAMITRAKTGTTDASMWYTDALPYTDHVDTWAVPFVNYCYLNSIMVGNGDGTVSASANVTGVQAIKMALVALGYKPEVEGLVGANWERNTIALATRAGLLKNLEGVQYNQYFDREATAILVYNAIYAKTVEYLGNTAVASEYTLGEEVYDLLDVRATIVATSSNSIGLIYNDVLDEKGNYNKIDYVNYANAKSGTVSVVYRDYTGAATVGGYYVPRVLTLNAADVNAKNSELGNTYRILTTGCKTPYNTTEVRKVYGILDAENNGYKAGYAANIVLDADKTEILDNMAAMAAKLGYSKDAVLDNLFINGGAVSYNDMYTWYTNNNASNSPVIINDFDGDGVYDTVQVWTRSYWEVIDVTDTTYFLSGSKIVALAKADTALELVEGDWVSNDGLYGYQKLATVSGTATAISTSGVTIADVTVSLGTESVTTNAAKIYNALGGVYAAGVNATIWYDANGAVNYAVDAELNDAATWQNYGIVTGWSDDVLGMQTVRIFTAENTYETYVVTSINGNKKYDQYMNSDWYKMGINTLVKYYVDGNTVALYDYDSHLMIGDTNVPATLTYSTKYDLWNDTYTWNDAVIFASVEGNYQNATDEKFDLVWRAYRHDEFQPLNGTFTGSAQGIVNNLSNYIKVAAITGEQGTILPGLVIGNDQWLTLTKNPVLKYSAVEDGTVTYTYELTYVNANTKPSTTSTATVKSNLPLNVDIADGDIVRATFNEDGEVIYWVDATPNKFAVGTNGLELGKLMLKSARTTAKGITEVEVNDVIINGTSIVKVDGVTMTLADDCDFYLVKNIGGDCSTVDAAADVYGDWVDVLNRAAAKSYTVYADVNIATYEINSIWIDTTVLATENTVPATITVTYDEATQTVKYTAVADDDNTVTFSWTESNVLPYQLPCNDGATVKGTITVAYGKGATGAAVNADEFDTAVVYNYTNAQAADWADGLKLYTDKNTNKLEVEYEIDGYTQIWWLRSNSKIDEIERVHKISQSAAKYPTLDDALFTKNGDATAILATAKNTTYEPAAEVDAQDYGMIYVVATGDHADIIVLVDTNDSVAPIFFPYTTATK